MLFIFDENFSPKLSEGLHLLEQGNRKSENIASVTHIVTLAGKYGTADDKVIEIAGANKGIIVTQDNDFRRMKHKYPLYNQHKVGVIFFQSYKDSKGYWNMIKSVITQWVEIKNVIQDETPPFAYKVNRYGIEKLHF